MPSRSGAAIKRQAESARLLEHHLGPVRAAMEPLISSWLTNLNFTFTDRRASERVFKAAGPPPREACERGEGRLAASG